jgi:hypothetical protein
MWSFAITLGLIQEQLEAAGRYGDAVAATREQAALYRHLATVRPDQYLSHLADVLANLSRLLAASGDRVQARAVHAEADSIRPQA